MVQYTASQTSLVKSPSSMAEMYIPLWVYSSSYAGNGSVTFHPYFVVKGSTTPSQSTTDSNAKLHTLNSNWSSSQKFALEASISIGTSTRTITAALWDFTAGAIVSDSQISTSSTTFTVLRSSQFTLTPGRIYGVSIVASVSDPLPKLSKAHLVAFL